MSNTKISISEINQYLLQIMQCKSCLSWNQNCHPGYLLQYFSFLILGILLGAWQVFMVLFWLTLADFILADDRRFSLEEGKGLGGSGQSKRNGLIHWVVTVNEWVYFNFNMSYMLSYAQKNLVRDRVRWFFGDLLLWVAFSHCNQRLWHANDIL